MFEFSYKNKGGRMVVLRCIGPSKFFLKEFYFHWKHLLLWHHMIQELKYGEMNCMDRN